MYADEILRQTGGLFRCEIRLDEAFEDDDSQRAELVNPDTGEPYMVVLRELKSRELTTYMGVPDDKKFDLLVEMLPSCIVDSNLIKKDGGKLKAEEAAALITESGSILVHVLQRWQSALPLVRKRRKDSDGSRPSSSPAEG